MAKKDKKNGNALHLPKEVLGIKIGKKTRRQVNAFLELLESPQAKAIAGSAVAVISALLTHEAEKHAHDGDKQVTDQSADRDAGRDKRA